MKTTKKANLNFIELVKTTLTKLYCEQKLRIILT